MLNNEFSINNLTNKHVKFFKKEGFLLGKNLISRRDIEVLKRSIYSVLEKTLKKLNGSKKKINEKNVHANMIMLRSKRPDLFANFFDTMQTSSVIYLVFSNIKILNTASKLLQVKNHETTLTDVGIRFDPPNDEKNTINWHQDSSYYRQNDHGKNGVVLWVPLFKIEKNMGTLQYLRFSHNLGPLNVPKKSETGKFLSSKREIKLSKLKKFKKILESNVRAGDILFMNLDLVHRSGKNSNLKKVRIAMLGRFHKMLSSDFNPGLNIYRFSDKKLNFKVHGF